MAKQKVGKAVARADECGDAAAVEAPLAEDDLCDYIPTPPDGGYGWVIMAASFVNNAILDGIAYCFGVFLADYSNAFGSTRAETSLLGALLCGVYLLVGPIAGALVNKFGCRPVGIAGSIIGAAAFLISIASPNLQLMYFTYGVVGGFGFGLMYLPAVVGVGYYFDKKRALATGIAVCGTGVGTMALAPFSRWLLNEYDWKSAHFILAGIVLHGVISSALMRPLEPKKKLPSAKGGADKVIIACPPPESGQNGAVAAGAPTGMGSQVVAFTKQTSMGSQYLRVELPASSLAVHYGGFGDQHGATAAVGSVHKLGSNAQLRSRSGTLNVTDLSRPMYKKDIFYSGSVYNVAIDAASPPSDDRKYIASVMSVPTVEQTQERRTCFTCLPKPVADVLNEMMDVSLFKDKTVIILSLANFVGMLGFYIPYMYSTDRAIQLGIDSDRGALLISIIGITNTIGRVLFGAAATLPRVSSLLLHNVCTLIAAFAVAAMPLCTTFETMALASAAYGFFCSCLISFTTIIICDLLGLEKLTNCFGIIAMVRGITACVGPPLAAMLYDITKNYDLTFYVGGACIVACALLHFLLHMKVFKSAATQAAVTAKAASA